MPDVADDADDLTPWCLLLRRREPRLDALSDRIGVSEILAREALVDDDHPRRRVVICLRKIAPADERNVQRPEVAGTHHPEVGAEAL